METLYQDSSVAATLSFTGERVCSTCNESKHITEFVVARRIVRGDGRGGVDSRKGNRKNICKPCQRIKSAEFTKKNPGYWADRYRKQKEQPSTDDSWRGLDAALSMCQRTTLLQKAA